MKLTVWESQSPAFAYTYLSLNCPGFTTLSAAPCFFRGVRHILLTVKCDLYEEAFLASYPVMPVSDEDWTELFSRDDTRQIDGRTIRHLDFADVWEAADLAERICECHDWAECSDILPDFCELAGMRADFEAAGGEDFERVLFEAADFLGLGVDLLGSED